MNNSSPKPYEKGELLYWSFLRGGTPGNGSWTHYQGPTPFQVPGGRLYLVWNAYMGQETFNDNASYYAVSDDSGLTWSEGNVFHAEPAANVSHHSFVHHPPSGRIIMMWREAFFRGATPESKTVSSIQDYAKSQSRIYCRISNDEMRSWSAPREIDVLGEIKGDVFFYGGPHKPLALSSGNLLLPVTYLSNPDPQTHSVRFLVSDDAGNTWERAGDDVEVDAPRGAMEPNIIETAPNQLFCLYRTKAGYRYRSLSEDGGNSWSKPEPTDVTSPESIAALCLLASGALLLVRNPVSTSNNWPRYPLVASLSDDNGKTWSRDVVIQDESGRNQLSNFGMIQLADQRIVLAISHYHAIPPTSSDIDMAIFDEEFVRSQL